MVFVHPFPEIVNATILLACRRECKAELGMRAVLPEPRMKYTGGMCAAALIN